MRKVKRGNLFLIGVMLINISLTFVLFDMFHFQMNNTNLLYAIREVICPGIIIALFFLFTRQSPQKVFLFKPLSLKNVLLVIALTLTIIPISGILNGIADFIFRNPGMTDQIRAMSTGSSLVLALLITAVQPAIIEELSFRGIVAHAYSDYDIKIMAIMSGLLFGMFHLNFNQFFGAAFFGTIAAFVLYYTKSIFATMLMHFLNNGLSVLIGHISTASFNADQASLWPTGEPLAAIIIAIAIVIIILLIIIAVDILLFRTTLKALAKYNKKRLGDELTVTFEGGAQTLKATKENLKHLLFNPTFIAAAVIFLAFAIYVQITGHF